MRVFLIGDVVGAPGCNFLREKLPAFKQKEKIDVVIANGENSAVGNGVLPGSAGHIFDSGVDVITGATIPSSAGRFTTTSPTTRTFSAPPTIPNAPMGKGGFCWTGEATPCWW